MSIVLFFAQYVLQSWFDVWKIRNDDRHGADEKEQQVKRLPFLHSQLEELYSYKPVIMPQDSRIFHETLESHLADELTPDQLEQWILIWKPAILSSHRQYKARNGPPMGVP
jgi:hypothetical protein